MCVGSTTIIDVTRHRHLVHPEARDNGGIEYEHTQYGYTGILTLVLMVGTAWFSLPETFAESMWMGLLMVLFVVGIVAVTFWFSRLVVTVAEGAITAVFGLGKPHRAIQLSDVADVHQVRNRWIQGLGVRRVANGWMYNVWGLDAVEVELKSGTVFRIGTDDVDRLHAAISLSTNN